MCVLERNTVSRAMFCFAMRTRVWRDAAQALFLLGHHGVAPYFFFVSFSTTRSSA
jgi:hypothetical protein